MPDGSPRDNRIITVPDALIERASKWGAKTQDKMSKKVDRKRVGGARASAEDRGVGKMAEAALAMLLGLDVKTAVEWRVLRGGDSHRDLTVTINDTPKTVDVKASAHQNAQYLIWPRTQEFRLMADILVFVKVAPFAGPTRGQVFIPGFMVRQDFIRNHEMVDLRRDGRRSPVVHWKNLMPIHILKNAIRTCWACKRSTPRARNGQGYCLEHIPAIHDGASPRAGV